MTPPNQFNPEQFKTQLCERRKIILVDIRTDLHRSDDPDQMELANHLEAVSDWAEADLLNDTEIALLGNALTELRDIDAALARIKTGTYGICTECGEAIPPARLSAQPTARRCLTCQAEAEKRPGAAHNPSI